jgi:hypothetical protein
MDRLLALDEPSGASDSRNVVLLLEPADRSVGPIIDTAWSAVADRLGASRALLMLDIAGGSTAHRIATEEQRMHRRRLHAYRRLNVGRRLAAAYLKPLAFLNVLSDQAPHESTSDEQFDHLATAGTALEFMLRLRQLLEEQNPVVCVYGFSDVEDTWVRDLLFNLWELVCTLQTVTILVLILDEPLADLNRDDAATLWLESVAGEGTTRRVVFPILDIDALGDWAYGTVGVEIVDALTDLTDHGYDAILHLVDFWRAHNMIQLDEEACIWRCSSDAVDLSGGLSRVLSDFLLSEFPDVAENQAARITLRVLAEIPDRAWSLRALRGALRDTQVQNVEHLLERLLKRRGPLTQLEGCASFSSTSWRRAAKSVFPLSAPLTLAIATEILSACSDDDYGALLVVARLEETAGKSDSAETLRERARVAMSDDVARLVALAALRVLRSSKTHSKDLPLVVAFSQRYLSKATIATRQTPATIGFAQMLLGVSIRERAELEIFRAGTMLLVVYLQCGLWDLALRVSSTISAWLSEASPWLLASARLSEMSVRLLLWSSADRPIDETRLAQLSHATLSSPVSSARMHGAQLLRLHGVDLPIDEGLRATIEETPLCPCGVLYERDRPRVALEVH